MNKALINWWQGGASIDSDYQAWLTQIIADGGTEPSASVKTAQNALVVALKAASLWTRMKFGYFLHCGDLTTGRRNLPSPSTFRTTPTNTPDFLEGTGTKSNGSSSYISVPYAANQYAGIETDITFVSYIADSSNPSASGSSYGMRTTSGLAWFRMINKFSAGTSVVYRSQGGVSVIPVNLTLKGFYVDTYDGTQRQFYKNGVKTSETHTPSVPVIATPLNLLCYNNHASGGNTPTDYFPYYMSYMFAFNRFTDSDESTLRGLLTTYNTAAGLP